VTTELTLVASIEIACFPPVRLPGTDELYQCWDCKFCAFPDPFAPRGTCTCTLRKEKEEYLPIDKGRPPLAAPGGKCRYAVERPEDDKLWRW
jgi:hypothetical protein